MQDVLFAARVPAVFFALLLLPAGFSQSGASSSELCAAQAEGCVVEIASYCDVGDEWMVDRYRKDD